MVSERGSRHKGEFMQLRIEAPDIGTFAQERLEALSKAVTAAVAGVTEGAKTDLRRQIAGALEGGRAPNMVGSDVFPRSGRHSLKAAGSIYPRGARAELILRAHTDGSVIKAREGQWLAIPTDAVPLDPTAPRQSTRRMSPMDVEGQLNRDLRFVPVRRGLALLVADNMVAGRRAGTWRGATEKRRASGRGLATVIMFYLVRQARLRPKLTPNRIVETWAGRVPELIARQEG